jgi:hypothetical protein
LPPQLVNVSSLYSPFREPDFRLLREPLFT